MAVLSGIHWQAPSTVILALLAGTLFAVGHHLFYNNLDGQPARNDSYTFLGSSVSSQQINIAGGTAFAFLVKACLATAIGAAYAQLFWRAMLHRTPELNLQRLDATFSALTNVHHLFKVWTWWRYPILFSFALIAWLIPIASIVTPATLSIRSAPVTPAISSVQTVPNLDFVNLNYLNWMSSSQYSDSFNFPGEPVQYYYNGPSRAVTNIVQAVTAGGAILPLKHHGLNSSYTLKFPGPSIRCSNMPDELRAVVKTNIVQATQSADLGCIPYGFLGWTPAANLNNSGLLPKPLPFTVTPNGTYVLNAAPLTNRAWSTPASIYIAAIPEMMQMVSMATHQFPAACTLLDENLTHSVFAGSTFLQCDLLNSTYIADFQFVNGDQEVSISTTPIDDNVVTTAYALFSSSLYLGRAVNSSLPSCSPFNLNGDPCMFNSSLVSTLAYQAVFESFNELLVGSVIGDSSPLINTNVLKTSLIDTPDLAFLNQPPTSRGLVSLQQAVLGSNGTLYKGIYDNQTFIPNQPLSAAMEEMFRNITISLMTSRELQPDPKSMFAPAPANVTFHNYHNVYTYSAWKLWVAYGLAIFFASICALGGLIIIGANQASYSLGFSTVLRASKCAYTNVQLTEDDADIRDPLPPHLAKAKIWLGSPPRMSDKARPPANSNRAVETRTGDGGHSNRDCERADSNVDANAAEASSMLLRPQHSEQHDTADRASS